MGIAIVFEGLVDSAGAGRVVQRVKIVDLECGGAEVGEDDGAFAGLEVGKNGEVGVGGIGEGAGVLNGRLAGGVP